MGVLLYGMSFSFWSCCSQLSLSLTFDIFFSSFKRKKIFFFLKFLSFSFKNLCGELTFNRLQWGSCSATYETLIQKQVVYKWFRTRFPMNMWWGGSHFSHRALCPRMKGSPHRPWFWHHGGNGGGSTFEDFNCNVSQCSPIWVQATWGPLSLTDLDVHFPFFFHLQKFQPLLL